MAGSEATGGAIRNDRIRQLANAVSVIRTRMTDIRNDDWLKYSARCVAEAYDAGIALTAVLALGSTTIGIGVEIPTGHYTCSKEERTAINRFATEAQAQTVTAITTAVDETALAADSMSTTIAAIRQDTEMVTAEIDGAGRGFDRLDGHLNTLRTSTDDFARYVAA